MNKFLAVVALLLFILLVAHSQLTKVVQEKDCLQQQISKLKTEVNQLKFWKEEAKRREPWLLFARSEMTELEKAEMRALIEKIKQRRERGEVIPMGLKYIIFEEMHSADDEAATLYVTEIIVSGHGPNIHEKIVYLAWAVFYGVTNGAEEYDTPVGNKYIYKGCQQISEEEYIILKKFVQEI